MAADQVMAEFFFTKQALVAMRRPKLTLGSPFLYCRLSAEQSR